MTDPDPHAKMSAVDPARLFLILAPLIYLAFALLTPPFQTPDEHQHLFRAYQLAGGGIIGERRGNESGGHLPPSLFRAAQLELGNVAPHDPAGRPKPKTSLEERFSRATPLDASEANRFTNFLGAVTYTPVGYFPQMMAVWIGRALDLSVEAIIRLGRVLNVALTIALLYAALRVLPVGRMMLLIVGLLPMTAACAAALGQDGVIIGASALLTALGLQAITLGRWTRRAIAAAAVMTSLITLAKIVYLPLAGLALFPRPAHVRVWRWWLPPIMFGTIALALTALWSTAVMGLFVPMLPGMPSPAEQLAYLLQHPSIFPQAFAQTYSARGIDLAESLFLFGWLNIGPITAAAMPMFAAVIVAIWHGDANAGVLSPVWRCWSLAVSLITVVLLTLAIYILSTPLGTLEMISLQARYFIPLALPCLLPLLRRRTGDDRLAIFAIGGLCVLANAIVLKAIFDTFYV